MKLTLSWLKTFLQLNYWENNFINICAVLGLEINNLLSYKKILNHLILGQVLGCISHPNIKEVKILLVDIGKKTIQV